MQDETVFDDEDQDFELRMRDANLNALQQRMNTLGLKEGAGDAVEKYRQIGFEEGMIKGFKEGFTFGKWKGYAHAMSIFASTSDEQRRIKRCCDVLHETNIIVWSPEQMRAFQDGVHTETNTNLEPVQAVREIREMVPKTLLLD